MYFLTNSYVTSICGDVKSKGSEQRNSKGAASGALNGLSVLPKAMSGWVDPDSDPLAAQHLTFQSESDGQSAAPASPLEPLTVSFLGFD